MQVSTGGSITLMYLKVAIATQHSQKFTNNVVFLFTGDKWLLVVQANTAGREGEGGQRRRGEGKR